jgi:hypothetical protein
VSGAVGVWERLFEDFREAKEESEICRYTEQTYKHNT